MNQEILQLYKNQSQILFNRTYWLDAVCEGEWDIITAWDKKQQPVAFLPVHHRKYMGFKLLVNPPLTQFLHLVFLLPQESKLTKRMEQHHQAQLSIISQLPDFDYFDMNFDISYQNWLPFYWKGFHQTVRYTYLIDKNRVPAEKLFEMFRENIRRQVKKASDTLTVKEIEDTDVFYEILHSTFAHHGKKAPFSKALITRVFQHCKPHKSIQLLAATDAKDEIYGVIMIGKDDRYHHYLAGGSEARYRNSGVMSLLLYSAAKQALENGKDFNFEGSMIESIEYFFRSFGSVQTPYTRLVKYNNRIFSIAMGLKGMHLIR